MLKHPTPYHLEAKKKVQVEQFLSTQDGPVESHSPHLGGSPSQYNHRGVSPHYHGNTMMSSGLTGEGVPQSSGALTDFLGSPPSSLEQYHHQESPLTTPLNQLEGQGFDDILNLDTGLESFGNQWGNFPNNVSFTEFP